MSDIVGRLAKRAAVTEIIKDNPKIYYDAMYEIERLRAENEKLRGEERERCAKICEENNDDAVMQSYGTYYATRIRKS